MRLVGSRRRAMSLVLAFSIILILALSAGTIVSVDYSQAMSSQISFLQSQINSLQERGNQTTSQSQTPSAPEVVPTTRHLSLVAGETKVVIAPSVTYDAWTFNGTTTAIAGTKVSVIIPAGAGTDTSSLGFTPSTITVVIGVNNTVVWTNRDSVPHTVTSLDKAFDSGNPNSGDSFTYTFTIPGTYQYGRFYHPWMKGTVIVKGPFRQSPGS